jgi:hypothetical protein
MAVTTVQPWGATASARGEGGRRCGTASGIRPRRVRLWDPSSPLMPRRSRRCRSRVGEAATAASASDGHRRRATSGNHRRARIGGVGAPSLVHRGGGITAGAAKK